VQKKPFLIPVEIKLSKSLFLVNQSAKKYLIKLPLIAILLENALILCNPHEKRRKKYLCLLCRLHNHRLNFN